MKKLVIIAFVLVGLFPLVSHASCTPDATGTLANVNGTTATWAINSTANANSVAVVYILGDGNSANARTCNLGGVPMTKIGEKGWPAGTVYVDEFEQFSPVSGTPNVVCSSTLSEDLQGTYSVWSNIAQTPPEASSSANGSASPFSISLTTITNNDCVIMGGFPATNFVPNASTTQQVAWDGNALGTSGGIYFSGSPTVTPSTVTFGGTISASNSWAALMMTLQPYSAPATTQRRRTSAIIIQ